MFSSSGPLYECRPYGTACLISRAGVTVHTFDEDAVLSVLEVGADGLEHGVVNQRLSSDRVIALLQKIHATYVPTLWILGAEVTYTNLKAVSDAGVRVALGTDTFYGHGHFGDNTIAEAERAVQAGLAPGQVLRMATQEAAEHLGPSGWGGSRPGSSWICSWSMAT